MVLLAATQKETDQAITRTLEAVAVATMHTFTLVSYTATLRIYGILGSTAKALGLNRTGAMRDWGMKTLDFGLSLRRSQNGTPTKTEARRSSHQDGGETEARRRQDGASPRRRQNCKTYYSHID